MEALLTQLKAAKPMFEQTTVLFIFIAAGFVLSKLKKVDHSRVKLLSSITVYVTLPCSCLKTFINNFNREYIAQNIPC